LDGPAKPSQSGAAKSGTSAVVSCFPDDIRLVIVASFLGGLLAFQVWGASIAAYVALASLFVCGFLAARLTEPFAQYPAQTFATYRDLSRLVLAHNYTALSRQFGTWNPTDVWDALRIIIVEQLGVTPEMVTKDALLVSDLGMD
jgi:hypothetical protein